MHSDTWTEEQIEENTRLIDYSPDFHCEFPKSEMEKEILPVDQAISTSGVSESKFGSSALCVTPKTDDLNAPRGDLTGTKPNRIGHWQTRQNQAKQGHKFDRPTG